MGGQIQVHFLAPHLAGNCLPFRRFCSGRFCCLCFCEPYFRSETSDLEGGVT